MECCRNLSQRSFSLPFVCLNRVANVCIADFGICTFYARAKTLSLIYGTLLTHFSIRPTPPPQMCDKSLGAFDVWRVHNCGRNNKKRRTFLSHFSYPMVLSRIFTGNHDLVWFWALSNTRIICGINTLLLRFPVHICCKMYVQVCQSESITFYYSLTSNYVIQFLLSMDFKVLWYFVPLISEVFFCSQNLDRFDWKHRLWRPFLLLHFWEGDVSWW